MLINGQPKVSDTKKILQQLSDLPSRFPEINIWTKDNFERGKNLDLLSTAFKTTSIKELEEITMRLPSVVKEDPYITFRIYNAVGEIYNKLGDNEKAMENYNEAQNIDLTPKTKLPTTSTKPSSSKNTNQGWKI